MIGGGGGGTAKVPSIDLSVIVKVLQFTGSASLGYHFFRSGPLPFSAAFLSGEINYGPEPEALESIATKRFDTSGSSCMCWENEENLGGARRWPVAGANFLSSGGGAVEVSGAAASPRLAASAVARVSEVTKPGMGVLFALLAQTSHSQRHDRPKRGLCQPPLAASTAPNPLLSVHSLSPSPPPECPFAGRGGARGHRSDGPPCGRFVSLSALHPQMPTTRRTWSTRRLSARRSSLTTVPR